MTEPQVRERQMLTNLLECAQVFYQDPQNQRAFEAWKENRRKNNADQYDLRDDS